MRNKMIKKLIKGIFAGALACCCLLTATNVEAKSGYIYDSNNKPIQSSVGFVLNTEGVYNINSKVWKKNDKEFIQLIKDEQNRLVKEYESKLAKHN